MKLFLAIVFTLAISNVSAQKLPNRMVGNWEAVGADNQGIGIEIRDSSEIFIVFGTEKKRVTGFKADFSKSPAWFDFMIKEENEVTHIKSILQFVSDDLVQWQLFDGPERPNHFTEKEGEIVYLRRKR